MGKRYSIKFKRLAENISPIYYKIGKVLYINPNNIYFEQDYITSIILNFSIFILILSLLKFHFISLFL